MARCATATPACSTPMACASCWTMCAGAITTASPLCRASRRAPAHAAPPPVNAPQQPQFSLSDSAGQRRSLADWRGRWWRWRWLHPCPDVCPTTLSELKTAIEQLPAGLRGRVQVFATLDPARDVGRHPGRIRRRLPPTRRPRHHRLRGDGEADTTALVRALQLHAERQPAADGADYTWTTAPAFICLTRAPLAGRGGLPNPDGAVARRSAHPGARAGAPHPDRFLNHARPSFDFSGRSRAPLHPRRHAIRQRRRAAHRLGRHRVWPRTAAPAPQQAARHLSLQRQQLNLLAAAGAVDKAECGFSGLEVFGFANGLRRAVESGQTALEDYSNLAMALRLLGGALNWPFVPATVNIGSDIQHRSAFAPEDYPATTKSRPSPTRFPGGKSALSARCGPNWRPSMCRWPTRRATPSCWAASGAALSCRAPPAR